MNKKNILEIQPFKSKLKNSFEGIPPPLPQKHFVMSIYAKRGSGKTVLARNILRIYKNVFKKENRFIISPTIFNDDTLWGFIPEENRFSYYSDELIDFILEIIEEDFEEVKGKVRQRAIGVLMNQRRFSNLEDPGELPEKEIEKMYEKMMKKTKKQDYILIFDDVQGLLKLRSKGVSLAIKHRHFNISLIYMFQTFREAPVVLRTNSTFICIYDAPYTEIKKYSEEFSVYKRESDFIRMFEENVFGYNFLVIDRNAPKKKRYYQNFTKMIDFDEYNK